MFGTVGAVLKEIVMLFEFCTVGGYTIGGTEKLLYVVVISPWIHVDNLLILCVIVNLFVLF